MRQRLADRSGARDRLSQRRPRGIDMGCDELNSARFSSMHLVRRRTEREERPSVLECIQKNKHITGPVSFLRSGFLQAWLCNLSGSDAPGNHLLPQPARQTAPFPTSSSTGSPGASGFSIRIAGVLPETSISPYLSVRIDRGGKTTFYKTQGTTENCPCPPTIRPQELSVWKKN